MIVWNYRTAGHVLVFSVYPYDSDFFFHGVRMRAKKGSFLLCQGCLFQVRNMHVVVFITNLSHEMFIILQVSWNILLSICLYFLLGHNYVLISSCTRWICFRNGITWARVFFERTELRRR